MGIVGSSIVPLGTCYEHTAIENRKQEESLGKEENVDAIHNLNEHLMNLSMQEAQQKEDSEEVIPENNTTTHAANQVTGSQARIMADETLIDSLGTQHAAVEPKFLCPPTFNPMNYP
ncbi:hypothetical protein JTB14_032331 [Gonioctena quinquepunctata]|nr:hypothetical protein JTB14_032331 [Gonioctena quinquepunctata]